MKRKIALWTGRTFLWLAFGLCLVVLGGMAYFFHSIGTGFSHWGETVVYSDKEAKEVITQCGFHLPEDSRDVHYAIEGFQDHCVWIKFSVPDGTVWSAIESLTHKTRNDFSEDTSKMWVEAIPQHRDQHLDLTWWNPHQIARPRSWSLSDQRGIEVWTVDEEKSVIYRWSGDS